MKPNYSVNKRRREEANRKKQEEKRNRRLNKSKGTSGEVSQEHGVYSAQEDSPSTF